ncbi:MAG: hypothetical protein HC880_04380 [Bacteroidia bacterium]|nr:hypothetical protein [Bacteroidia bacterium]
MQDPKHVFEKEVQALNHAKSVLREKNNSLEKLAKEYEMLSKDYEKLLGDARVITNISDRLQNRLNKANDELNRANRDLQSSSAEINRKNDLLQNTIDELTKARVSKKATTIVLMAAILLFLVSEVFWSLSWILISTRFYYQYCHQRLYRITAQAH